MAASRNTYAWYVFILAPILSLCVCLIVGKKKPLTIAIENIRSTINYILLTIGLVVFNLAERVPSASVVLVYLVLSGVSLTISMANLVYAKVGLVYKLRPKLEYGDRKESEIELKEASRM